jgi:rRNA biogenesis protein RRP5
MDVDRQGRKVTLTLKKGLIDSKLPAITHSITTKPGSRTHGWISGITDKGIFVGFYNKVKGLVPLSEVALAAGMTLQESYNVGQVLKVTVVGNDLRKGLRLSLSRTPSALAAQPDTGTSVADGDALSVTEGQILRNLAISRIELSVDDADKASVCYLTAATLSGGTVTARLVAEHLSDHAHAADALATSITEGCILSEVVVLETRLESGLVIVSRKACLLQAAEAGELPCRMSDLKPGMRVAGFIASVTNDACFVRFGGGLTGRAGLPQLADSFVSDPRSHFRVGQSVWAVVLDVVEAQGRFSLSLKPSVACLPSSHLLESLFVCVPLCSACLQVLPWRAHACCGRL